MGQAPLPHRQQMGQVALSTNNQMGEVADGPDTAATQQRGQASLPRAAARCRPAGYL